MARAAFGCNSITELFKRVRTHLRSRRYSPILNAPNCFADLLRQIEVLRRDYFIAKKEGIVCADKEFLPPQSEKCKEILRNVEILLKCIDRNNTITHESFPAGAKLFVVGQPFWNEIYKEVQLFAYNIYDDSGPNRDMEIKFKNNLYRLYETRYLKFTRDGKRVWGNASSLNRHSR